MTRKIEPVTDWEPVLRRIERELFARQQYRAGGKPCPLPLARLEQKLRLLTRVEQELRVQAQTELALAAHRALAEIYAQQSAALAQGAHGPRPGGGHDG